MLSSTPNQDKSSHENHKPTSCMARSFEPDVTVVVGGVTFREYGVVLCCLSEYFDGAFSSGMQETTTRCFNFPDRDPQEWELLMSVFGLYPTVPINKINVETLLSWCDELCMTKAFDACSKFYLEELIAPATESVLQYWYAVVREAGIVKDFFQPLGVCVKYNLKECMQCACPAIRFVLEDKPKLFSYESVSNIVRFLENPAFAGNVWKSFRQYVSDVALQEAPRLESKFIKVICPRSVYERMKLPRHDPLENASHVEIKGAGAAAVNGLYERQAPGSFSWRETETTFPREVHINRVIHKLDSGGPWFLKREGSSDRRHMIILLDGYWYITNGKNDALYMTRTANSIRKNPPSSPFSWEPCKRVKTPTPQIVSYETEECRLS